MNKKAIEQAQPNMDEFDSVELDEVAQSLHISRATIYRMHKDGKIPTFHMGKSIRMRRNDLRRLIDNEVEQKFRHAA